MTSEKMNAIIDEVSGALAERDELVHTIALALLTKKNLFVLGEPGQAKSQAIDMFRKHITGAKQFEILMSKGIDQEQLFGRLDLASIIPGHVSNARLNSDPKYCAMRDELRELTETAQTDAEFMQLAELQGRMSRYQGALSLYHQGTPEILTENKIPESHICFLDECFKANDGVLNSLLKALNERVYTNEGITADIPVISFFAASNEIPNFNNPEEKSLRALYDRFDFKVCTRYVENKDSRMRILKQKQKGGVQDVQTTITLDELETMQDQVRAVAVPDGINELADNILCELRRKNISVTDRTYFNFAPVVQAEAFLHGRDTVEASDMTALINYLWDKPEEYATVQEVVTRLTENPLGEKLNELLATAYQHQKVFEDATDKNQALVALRDNLLAVYEQAEILRSGLPENDVAAATIDGMLATLEIISKEAHEQTNFTYLPLSEIKEFKNLTR